MEYALILELIIVVIVVTAQLYFYFSTLQKIKTLSSLFPEDILDGSYIQASRPNSSFKSESLRTDEELFSRQFNGILDSINKYLLKNRGATDFSIIKSIVERTVDSKENHVASNLSLPLYIGLMGTFSGIIIGLAQIAFAGGVTDGNINSFVGGVVIAMVASFFGLLLTVLNNAMNFKNAKAICDERKNQFYNFLQSELLPHLGSSLYDALDRLKVNLNEFNKKFENNINLFDTKFSDNIGTLKDTVDTLSGTIGLVVENTETQRQFLSELQKMAYRRMAEANIKVFDALKDAGPIFIEFISKQRELNISVDRTTDSIQSIGTIFDRVKAFEESINNLGESINTKQFLGNEVLTRIDKNLHYLERQFELLKDHEIKSSEMIEDFFAHQYKKIQVLTDDIKREIEGAFDIKIPNNPFQKLLLLESLDNQVKEIHMALKSGNGLGEKTTEINSKDLYDSQPAVETREKAEPVRVIDEPSLIAREPEVIYDHQKEGDLDGEPESWEDKRPRTIFGRITNLFHKKGGRKA